MRPVIASESLRRYETVILVIAALPHRPNNDLNIGSIRFSVARHTAVEANIARELSLSMVLADVRLWHLASFRCAAKFVRFWTKADNRRFWLGTVCPLMTRSEHWLCTAAMVLMPVSAPIEVPV
jgi:hypothetical protein